MSTNCDASLAFHSFVFKLRLAGASSREENRRYGFAGDLRQPAVFSGLCTRTTQVFKLAPGSFHLATIDRLGRQVSLNSHDDFLRHVCKPTLSYENLNTVKLDPKGRIVLHFQVVREPQISADSSAQVKGSEKQPQQEQFISTGTLVDVSEPNATVEASGTAMTGLLIDVSSSDAAANPEQAQAAVSNASSPSAVPVSAVGSGALPPPTHYHYSHPHGHGLHRHNETASSCRPGYNPYTSPARHRHQHGSSVPPTTTPMVSYGPTAHVSAMIHRLERRRQLHEQTMRDSSSAANSSQAPPCAAASTSALAPADEKTPEPATASNGYTPAYVTDVPITEKAEAGASPSSPKLSPPSSPVAETWTGVKNIITTFVRDFNRHLADNMGDEFRDFRLASAQRNENRSRDASTSSDPGTNKMPIHLGVFCDACHTTIQGVRHKCLHCSNYDMCDVCVVMRRDRHNVSHTFAQIERPGAPPAVVSHTPAASTSQASSEEVERKDVHSNVVCDVCDHTIIGIRHKCLSCGNYDMCENCIADRRDAHDLSHVFAQIVRPGAAPAVVTVRSESTARAPPSSSVYNADVQHPATCDRCHGSVRGVRYKCLQCPDWDACSACHDGHKLKDVHPGHLFVPIYDPKLFATRYNGVTPAHHEGIVCDACDVGPIVGARYRCMHPDCNQGDSYDLCATCEADPIARHPIDHPLLKIRAPMRPTPENHRVVNDVIDLVQRHLSASSNAGASTSTSRANPAFPEEVPIAVAAIGKVVANVMRKWGIEVAGELPTTLLDGPGPEEDAAASSEDEAAEAHEESSAQMAMSQVDMAGAYPTETPIVEAQKVAEKEVTIEPSTEQPVEWVEQTLPEEVVPVAEELVKVAAATAADEAPRASFVADVTLSDGSLVPSGAMFTKIWRVTNSGNVAWPASSRLVNLGGFTRMRPPTSSAALEFAVPIAQPGETVELSCELQAPEDEGKYMDHWRLVNQSTQDYFGDRFWVAIVVESAHASSENSLTSSSFIAPAPETNRAGTETDTRSTVSSVSSDELSNPEEDEEFIHAGVSSDEDVSSDEHDVESVVDDEEFVVLSDEDF